MRIKELFMYLLILYASSEWIGNSIITFKLKQYTRKKEENAHQNIIYHYHSRFFTSFIDIHRERRIGEVYRWSK
jgi:hypothetical protein